jgi:hypothetical protein
VGQGGGGAGDASPLDLEGLLEVVKSLSLDSARVGNQLGTLLGAVRPFRWVGWVLLAMALFNSLLLLVGLERMNPESEFKTLAALAETAAVPLIGVVMVFWGGTFRRGLWELRLLKGVSWFCLLGALGYLGGIPLMVQDVQRLLDVQQQRAAQGQERLAAEFGQAAGMLQRLDDPRALEALAGRILGQPAALSAETGMEALKGQAAGQLAGLEQEKRRAMAERAARERKGLWLEGAKAVGQALLAGVIFLVLWRSTAWARRLDTGRTLRKAATRAKANAGAQTAAGNP